MSDNQEHECQWIDTYDRIECSKHPCNKGFYAKDLIALEKELKHYKNIAKDLASDNVELIFGEVKNGNVL